MVADEQVFTTLSGPSPGEDFQIPIGPPICDFVGPGTVESAFFGFAVSAPIVDNALSQTGTTFLGQGKRTRTVTGTFTSESEASGGITVTFDNDTTSSAVCNGAISTNWSASKDPDSLRTAVLPNSRATQVGTEISVFAAIINSGQDIAENCRINALAGVNTLFSYQIIDLETGQISDVLAIDIPPGDAQFFRLSLTPMEPFGPTQFRFRFDCANSQPAPVVTGLNTMLLSASDHPLPDIFTVAVTSTGDGIHNTVIVFLCRYV